MMATIQHSFGTEAQDKPCSFNRVFIRNYIGGLQSIVFAVNYNDVFTVGEGAEIIVRFPRQKRTMHVQKLQNIQMETIVKVIQANLIKELLV